jgi:hypothetical protein
MKCINCDLNYKELNSNLCVFCEIIKENKKQNLFDIIIGFSKLTQLEIIKKTYEFFIKNDRIPYPNEIDMDVSTLRTNPYTYREINKDYKIFFTNTIDLNKIRTRRFPLKYFSQNLDIRFHMCDKSN